MSEVNYTFRVDGDLKQDFIEIAKQNDRSGSNLLREFIRHYVESEGKSLPAPTSILRKDTIPDAEKQRRKDAVAYGQGSVALEGFPITQDAKDLAHRFVAGELTLDEYAGNAHER